MRVFGHRVVQIHHLSFLSIWDQTKCDNYQTAAAVILFAALRKRGRVVDCTGLENRQRATFREFESHRFRQLLFKNKPMNSWAYFLPKCSPDVIAGEWRKQGFSGQPPS